VAADDDDDGGQVSVVRCCGGRVPAVVETTAATGRVRPSSTKQRVVRCGNVCVQSMNTPARTTSCIERGLIVYRETLCGNKNTRSGTKPARRYSAWSTQCTWLRHITWQFHTITAELPADSQRCFCGWVGFGIQRMSEHVCSHVVSRRLCDLPHLSVQSCSGGSWILQACSGWQQPSNHDTRSRRRSTSIGSSRCDDADDAQLTRSKADNTV
jgi:hypothetical protein